MVAGITNPWVWDLVRNNDEVKRDCLKWKSIFGQSP